jgi:hypothetical protein
MGWRAQHAYDEDQREEWRRFMAAQPLRRRIYIRARQSLFIGAIAAILFGPFVASIVRGYL